MASTSSLLWGRASSKFALQYVWNVSRRLQSPVFSNTFQKEHNEEKTSLTIQGYFASKDRSKETFLTACDVFRDKGPHLRGHLYKKLLNLMPKGKMIPQNMFQVEFMHYPKQQQCAIDCLEQMETHGVMPDTEMEQILLNAFECVSTKDVEDAIEDTWIVSGQSLVQQDLLNKHSPDEPIKVEGPFRIFLRDKCVGYFILRAEAKPRPPPLKRQEIDDVGDLKFWFTGEMQPDEEVAVYFWKDSLLSWIRLLENTNPNLANIPVLFTQASPIGDIMTTDEHDEPASVETVS
ncbi:Evolutionarily conserved signaling intermediate in Toll pathway-like [Homarus americanus]|uniref:Evolutionarily conserved signaling intermediate in Toll pathway, mitochondrial n=1 Tax=Homarus americanus TaxID=6706 RepID=A0A8J5K1D1_HOMAM|nr:Evolutionarily conserved signaling intermediate in Toll pathway-like [Homarus americanus]